MKNLIYKLDRRIKRISPSLREILNQSFSDERINLMTPLRSFDSATPLEGLISVKVDFDAMFNIGDSLKSNPLPLAQYGIPTA